jgi:ATP-dependent helicase HrpB
MLPALLEGVNSLVSLQESKLVHQIVQSLSYEQQRMYQDLPEKVSLPGGRRPSIEYEDGVGPSISSRLQDFFGMKQGPSLFSGKLPLVLHLLAPNGRDVQVTTDLAGFWKNHYPSIAKELRRKYPRHSWPDDPLTAEPPIRKG